MGKKPSKAKIWWPFILTMALLLLALWAQITIQNQQKAPEKKELIYFPKTFGTWRGSDLTLDTEVIQMLDPDQLLFRRYRNPLGNTIDLYGVFYKSQGANRTMHSPLNCYPGSGWEVVEKTRVPIIKSSSGGGTFKITRLILQKGLQKRLLYYWYYAGGKLASNQYMNKLLTLYGATFQGRTDGGLMTVSAKKDEQGRQQEYMENILIPELLDYLSKQPISY